MEGSLDDWLYCSLLQMGSSDETVIQSVIEVEQSVMEGEQSVTEGEQSVVEREVCYWRRNSL